MTIWQGALGILVYMSAVYTIYILGKSSYCNATNDSVWHVLREHGLFLSSDDLWECKKYSAKNCSSLNEEASSSVSQMTMDPHIKMSDVYPQAEKHF